MRSMLSSLTISTSPSTSSLSTYPKVFSHPLFFLSFFFPQSFLLLLLIGGTIVFFDRKMLRNFRKDGHNWKKKKDGKTIKEAHEHLKVSVFDFIRAFISSCVMISVYYCSISRLVMRKGSMFTMPTVMITLPLFEGVTGYWTSMWQPKIV